jgi:hypothetical protein
MSPVRRPARPDRRGHGSVSALPLDEWGAVARARPAQVGTTSLQCAWTPHPLLGRDLERSCSPPRRSAFVPQRHLGRRHLRAVQHGTAQPTRERPAAGPGPDDRRRQADTSRLDHTQAAGDMGSENCLVSRARVSAALPRSSAGGGLCGLQSGARPGSGSTRNRHRDRPFGSAAGTANARSR